MIILHHHGNMVMVVHCVKWF